MKFKFICLLFFLLTTVNGAKILFFFALSTYSHRISVWPLVEKLASKGHQVTFVQPLKPKKPNPLVKEFFPKNVEYIGEHFEKMDLLSLRLEGGWEATTKISIGAHKMGLDICEKFLADEETHEWIAREKNFDLIIIDGLYNDCAFGLSFVFKAKTIIFGTSHPFGWWFDTFGIPIDSAISDIIIPYKQPLGWVQRSKNSLWMNKQFSVKHKLFYPELDKIFRKQFQDPQFPSISDLEKRTSLIFTNTHFSEEYSRSLPPLIVPIGGLHCEDTSQKLTKELETFINGTDENGFIYLSFGSAAKISRAPKEFQNIFYEALGKSKSRFIWKFEGKVPPEMPSNVYTSNWMPQQAILAHPKIKAFLTHGGLLGMQEAVWHAVPLLPVPLFAEQDYNAIRVDQSERGIMLDPNSLTTAKLEDAIHRVTTNPKYKKNMEIASKLFKDRPAKPVDTAIWWTEYVLRHSEQELQFLKPLAMNQTWYERRLIDAWAIWFILLITILLASVMIIKFIVRLISRKYINKDKVKTN